MKRKLRPPSGLLIVYTHKGSPSRRATVAVRIRIVRVCAANGFIGVDQPVEVLVLLEKQLRNLDWALAGND